MSGRLSQGPFTATELEALFAPLTAYARLGLAVSGGPDSLGLMLAAARWASQSGPALIVYSVDHGLRPEAAGEAAMVVRAAEQLGLPVRVLRWEGDKPTTGVQAAARAARYRLIAAGMRADDAQALVTAHHLEDQAETVLMRLAHGSGIGGLGGMTSRTAVEGVVVLRPLLAVPRARLMAEVVAAGLEPADDPSNRDLGYERVRWRDALPELGRLGLTPQRLALFARRAAEVERALAAMAEAQAREALSGEAGGGVSLRLDLLRDLPSALGIRLLILGIAQVAGQRPELAQVESLHAALVAKERFAARTLSGAIIRRGAGRVRVLPEPLRGARARRVPLTQSAGAALPQTLDAAQIVGTQPPIEHEPPLFRPEAEPTFAALIGRAPMAGTPGQD